MKIFLTNTFKRSAKKLHRKQLTELEQAISQLQKDPLLGELKTGDLAQVRVFKFHLTRQLVLLAYNYDEAKDELMLLSFASHENFYDKLKKQIRSS